MNVNIDISDDRIKDLLCGAFEGGSNYWYHIVKPNLANGLTIDDFREGGKMQDPQNYWHWAEIIPLVDGCSLTILDTEGNKEYTLDRSVINRGIQVMADKAPRHFADIILGNDDAETADVFLQCCLFGDIIYG